MITIKKINTIQERWGIDVVVQFTEEICSINITKTFSFADQKQLDLEYDIRMTKAVANIENEIAESKIPTLIDIAERVEEYFIGNTIMSKAEYEDIKNTELTRSIIG